MGATQSHERPSSAEPAPAPSSEPAVGEGAALIAERYRLLARLHAGTGGVLYRAEDLAFARPVAVRMLTPALSRDESVLERLRARLEASTTMARDDIEASGDLLDLIDLGRAENGQVFVVTELLTGDNLATLIARQGPQPWQAVRPLMVRACQILHLSHQHGLLRLDLQTRHLFPVRDKTQTSTLKILSPGIGDVVGDALWSSLDPASAARQLQYAAPEQLTGGRVDARTDIYALGIIMYELLCGHVPFCDERPAYVCARHLLEAPPPFPPAVQAAVPREVVGIIGRALAKAPAERWPTMRALANAMAAIDFGPCDLSGVLEVDAVQPQPPTPSASSPSMRIDPAARHAPSPAVRPRTLPPLRDAFMNAPTSDPAIAERAQAYERWFRAPEPGPVAHGSSSQMAWDEILAAAEEAVAAVASSQRSGTAGDSGVFTPERLLHSGEAATASMVRGRRPPPGRSPARPAPVQAPSEAPLPGVGPRIEAIEAAAASTTLQLGPDDLLGVDSPAGDSAADLRGALASQSAPALREVAAHSAPRWAVSPLEAPPARRSRPLVWAAAALIVLGAAAGGLQWLRPDGAAAPRPGVAAASTGGPEADRPRPPRLSSRPAPAALTVGSMAAPSQWIDPADLAVVEPAAGDPAPETAATATTNDLSQGTGPSPAALGPAAPPVAAAPGPAAPAAPGELTPVRPTRRRSAAPADETTSPTAGPRAARPAPADGPAAAGPRKTMPGARPPDAGHGFEAGETP